MAVITPFLPVSFVIIGCGMSFLIFALVSFITGKIESGKFGTDYLVRRKYRPSKFKQDIKELVCIGLIILIFGLLIFIWAYFF